MHPAAIRLGLAWSATDILHDDAAYAAGNEYERADGRVEPGPQPVNEQQQGNAEQPANQNAGAPQVRENFMHRSKPPSIAPNDGHHPTAAVHEVRR